MNIKKYIFEWLDALLNPFLWILIFILKAAKLTLKVTHLTDFQLLHLLLLQIIIMCICIYGILKIKITLLSTFFKVK